MVRLQALADAGEQGLCLQELAVLRQSIGHIPEREALSLGNIL